MEPDKSKKSTESSFWSNIFKSPAGKADLVKSLEAIPLFDSLSRRDLNNLVNIFHDRNYLAGELVFCQGDPGIGLYLIRDGEVAIIRENDSAEKIELAIFNKGDFFGELAMVDGEKRSASAIAKSDSRLAVVFKPDLDDFIVKYPKKGIQILNGIAHIIAVRLRTLNEEYFALRTQKLKVKEE